MNRFFYHSFPRRAKSDKTQSIKVLDSICCNGLLLVPEQISWTDPLSPNMSEKITATGRRTCFTELAPSELREHAESFGGFALEITIDNLRRMGAMPVIYVPDATSWEDSYAAIGTFLLAHLVSATTVISNISQSLKISGPTLGLKISMRNGQVEQHNFDPIETQGIRRFLTALERVEGIPFRDLHFSLVNMASIFYPTDNVRRSDILGYYRQREWRIFSGLYYQDKPTTTIANPEQVKTLLDIDNEFFSREMTFPDGVFKTAEKCHFLEKIRDSHFMHMVNRIIVPADCIDACREIVANHGFDVEVTSCH